MIIRGRSKAGQTDPGSTLAPIRLLVLGAFLSAILAGFTLFLSVMHVMSTTDDMSRADERMRAARIADILPHVPRDGMDRAVAALGAVAGLADLEIAPSASAGPNAQSMPLIGEPLGGSFLTWQAGSPGSTLFLTHAPTRVPVILAFIGGVLACLLAMLRYVRRIERQRSEAHARALRDHLTGLPNRQALEDELGRLAEHRRPFSVMALDLDRFKPINDLFGHHAGDLALVDVAQRLSAQLRPGELLARIGGDEFVAIVRRDGRPALTQLARDCIAAVGRPLHVVGQNVSVGISLGIVEEGLDHPAGALLKQADKALYQAKALEGGAFCFAGEMGTRRAGAAETSREPKRLVAGTG